MIDIDLNKKVQDILNKLINDSIKNLPEETINNELIELLKAIMTQTFYLGFREAIRINIRTNEKIIELLPKK